MKDYQIVTERSMKLPDCVYHQCLWIVRDMDRLNEVAGSEYVSLEVTVARERIRCISSALESVPVEFRAGILENIVKRGSGFGAFASNNTWRRWKQIFLYTFARNLGLY